jgi:hypothetical protein
MWRILLASVCAAAALVPAAARAQVAIHGCKISPEQAAKYAPDRDGPAWLVALTCAPLGPINGLLELRLAPDGDGFLALESHMGLTIGQLQGGDAQHLPAIDPPFRRLATSADLGFRWSSDSRFIWGLTQEVAQPSHFPTGPLHVERIGRDGVETRLPELRDSGGDLDGVLWVNGEGLALATFGLHGDRYRPPRATPDPTLAVVDFRKGEVRGSVPLSGLLGGVGSTTIPGILDAIAVQRPDGKVRTLMRLGPPPTWMLWTEGEAPRRIDLPFGAGRQRGGAVFLPGGDQVLVIPQLHPVGMICEHNSHCPAPTPVTGPLAALYDLASGKLIWQTEATASYFADGVAAAVSPDGLYAVIGVPAEADRMPRAGLISLRDGRVLQTFRGPWNSHCDAGFTADGRLWLNGGGLVAIYQIARGR